jgi:hypothetical protein
MLVTLGGEWWAEPMEQPADRDTLQEYAVDPQVLERWRAAVGGYVDLVFSGPPDHEPPQFVEVEDEQGRSVRYGEWVQRDDGAWVLRVPAQGV